MNGFLFNENLPINIEFSPSLPITHVSSLGSSTTDTKIWEYAKQINLVIITKDTDFSDRISVSNPPPRIVHLRFGNMRKKSFIHFSRKSGPKLRN